MATTAGLTGTLSGSSLAFSGWLSAVQAALPAGQTPYPADSEFEGTDTLHFAASSTEAAAVGSDTSLAASQTATLTVTGVADTPVLGTAADHTLAENAAVGLTGLSVSPADPSANDAADTYNVTLSVAHGTLSMATTAGLTGTLSGSSLAFSGSLSAVQAALADGQITYTADSEFEGTDTLHFAASRTEAAAVGSDTSLAASQTATLTVTGVADTPVLGTAADHTLADITAVAPTGLNAPPPPPTPTDAADTYN